jgi:hypothetical protein
MPAAGALIPVSRLARRLRQPRSRHDEVRALRRRLAAAAREPAGTEEIRVARELRQLRVELSAAFGDVASCAGCARGRPEATGSFDGGYCCGTRTEAVFTDDEVAALALAGTRGRDLRPPRGEHAGCSFRGATGCTLAPGDRPVICGHYVCRELERELATTGQLSQVLALADAVQDRFRAFARLRRRRREDEEWAVLTQPAGTSSR